MGVLFDICVELTKSFLKALMGEIQSFMSLLCTFLALFTHKETSVLRFLFLGMENWTVSDKEEELTEQCDVAGNIFSTAQNLAECNSTYTTRENCLDHLCSLSLTTFQSQ